jgi:hypothetical protein
MRTITERFVCFVLTTHGPKTQRELDAIVQGNFNHLERSLRSLRREGWIKKVDDQYIALSESERADWLTPAAKWFREGTTVDAHYDRKQYWFEGIHHAGCLEQEIRRMRKQDWFRLGDELRVRELFAEMSEVSDAE